MNQMELNTHECLQFFLPRIAVALEEIAKELKKHNNLNEVQKNDSTYPTESDTKYICRYDAYCMLLKSDIPVKIDSYGDVVLENEDLLIGEGCAYLSPVKKEKSIITLGSEHIVTADLTIEHINKFIADYKALEKELSK